MPILFVGQKYVKKLSLFRKAYVISRLFHLTTCLSQAGMYGSRMKFRTISLPGEFIRKRLIISIIENTIIFFGKHVRVFRNPSAENKSEC